MTPSIEQYLPDYADRLLKLAVGAEQQPGKMQKYMPWYGAGGLGAVGHHVGGKMVMPAKYRLLGSVAGTLAGTALGVHGGEALGKRLDKTAEEKPKPKSKVKEVAKTIGKGLGGMTLGTLAGFGVGKGLEHGARAAGIPIPKSALLQYGVPAVGAGLGTAYSLWKAREAQELKNAFEGT